MGFAANHVELSPPIVRRLEVAQKPEPASKAPQYARTAVQLVQVAEMVTLAVGIPLRLDHAWIDNVLGTFPKTI